MRVLSSGSHPGPIAADHGRVMRTVWKIVLVLALVLPTGAFVAGSLAASSADRPAPRHTIVIRDEGRSPSTAASPRHDRPSAGASGRGDGTVEVVTPTPHDLRDDHGGTRGGSGGGSGHGSGSGSGRDDSGGHGGRHG